MFDFINFTADKIQVLILVIIRTSGIFILAPIFGDRMLPTQIKVGLAILLSLLLVPTFDMSSVPVAESLWQLAGMAFHELFVGMLIGMFFMLLFWAAQMGGSLVGYQIGFAMVTVLDPSTKNQVSIIGRFWFIIAALFFLSINGHHLIISALADSYRVIPVATADISGTIGEVMIRYTAYVFVLALKIASPIMITLFLTDVSLGTVAKLMPTMNVFFVGFPIKIGVGLTVMAISLPIMTWVLEKSLHYLDGELRTVLFMMGKS